ncbi:MAG: inosine/xanthosine triphosphatase [Candidatus Spechtbacterales bacterium]
MRVRVGTKNEAKLGAVTDALSLYEAFRDAIVEGIEVASGVSDQPKELAEIVQGAVSRAKAAFEGCEYSIGLESGLMGVPHTKSGYMDVAVCAIFDGKDVHLGLSSGFEPPKEVVRLVFEEGHNLGTASKIAGLTEKEELGKHEGLIGILTKGRMDRKEQAKQAVITAMLHIDKAF